MFPTELTSWQDYGGDVSTSVPARAQYDSAMEEFYYYMNITHWFVTIVYPMLGLFGTIGNIISFWVLKKYVGNQPTYNFLCALSVTDGFFLVAIVLYWFIYGISDGAIDLKKNIDCNFVMFSLGFSSLFSSWLILAVTAERLVYMFYPFWAKHNWTITKARVFIGFLAAAAMLANAPFLGGLRAVQIDIPFLSCEGRTPGLTDYYYYKYSWVSLFCYSLIPSLVIIVSNCMLVHKFRRMGRVRVARVQHSNEAPGIKVTFISCPGTSSRIVSGSSTRGPPTELAVTMTTTVTAESYTQESRSRSIMAEETAGDNRVYAFRERNTDTNGVSMLESGTCTAGESASTGVGEAMAVVMTTTGGEVHTGEGAERKTKKADRATRSRNQATASRTSLHVESTVGQSLDSRTSPHLPTERDEKILKQQSKASQKRRVIILSLILSFSFITLTLPFSLFHLYVLLTPPVAADQGVQYLLSILLKTLAFANHAVNFLLYCVANAKFKAEVYSLNPFKCCKK